MHLTSQISTNILPVFRFKVSMFMVCLLIVYHSLESRNTSSLSQYSRDCQGRHSPPHWELATSNPGDAIGIMVGCSNKKCQLLGMHKSVWS